MLYKNFVIDEYQLFQARLCGASAVLLIAACLTVPQCSALLKTAHELGLEVLLEMHSESEMEYAELEPDMCGINNRNLGSFVTDVQNSFRLAELLPKDANTCVVYRRHVPDHQLTGGIDGGLVANMIEPNVKCNFKAENGKRIYTVTFPKFYLQPMMLDPGHLPGIGIKVYDRDDAEARGAKQVLTNIPPGEGDAFQRPDLYTQLLFMKGSK